MRSRATTARVVPVVVLALLVSGCTAREIPLVADLTVAERSQYADQQRDEDWAAVAHRFPTAERPVVERVEFMAPSWIGVTIAGCLANAGFPSATYSPDGGVSPGPAEPERAEELAVATYVCATRYPASPDQQSRLSRRETARLHGYFSGRLAPCLEAAGRAVGDIPPLAEFDGRLRFGPVWSPYGALGPLPPAERAQLEVRCPLYPEGFRDRHPGFFLY